MFRKVFLLAAMVFILCACNAQAEVIDSSWDGGKEGTWDDAK